MAAPRIRLSPIKLAPAPVIVPIVNPDTPAVVAPPESTTVAVPPLSVVPPLSIAPPVAEVPPAPEAAVPGVGVPPVSVTPDAANSPVPAPAPLPGLAIVARPASAASAAAAQTDEPVSTGLMTASAAPSRIRASSTMVKWSAISAMLLLVAFAAMKFLIPVVIEMRKEKVANPVADKNAPTAVRAIQATRQVVAKSDANVAYLNEVVAAVENKPAEVKPATQPVPRAVVAPPASDLSRFQDAVAQLKVDGVVSGATPRAYIDGRFVKHGEIINRALGLRFVGVDPDEHMLLFTNADNVTFRKRY